MHGTPTTVFHSVLILFDIEYQLHLSLSNESNETVFCKSNDERSNI